MTTKRLSTVLALASVILLVGAGCNSTPTADNQNNDQNTQIVNPTPTPQTTPDQTQADATTTQPTNEVVINLNAKDWKWDPGTINVKKGDHVKIVVTNNDPVAHGFGMPDYNVNQVIDAGATQTIEFVADQAGTFNFFCSVPCGPGHRGMKGTLIVT